MIDLFNLLRKPINHPFIEEFILGLNQEPKETEFYVTESLDKTFTYFDWDIFGLCIAFNNKIASSIFLYSEGYQGHKQYSGEIPMNVSFKDTRLKLHAKLGLPSDNGFKYLDKEYNEFDIIFGKDKNRWDKWIFKDNSFHVQYFPNDTIEMITLE